MSLVDLPFLQAGGPIFLHGDFEAEGGGFGDLPESHSIVLVLGDTVLGGVSDWFPIRRSGLLI